jgi:hypothetical protein
LLRVLALLGDSTMMRAETGIRWKGLLDRGGGCDWRF